jgi:hypothetical protein
MKWTELKIDVDWLVHLGADDNGVSNGRYIIKHIKCVDGAVLPGVKPVVCTECHSAVPEDVIKRLPFIINRDKLIN